MTTIASPTVGGAVDNSVWWVRMEAGAAGPLHVVDAEQVWTVLEGTLRVDTSAETHELGPGDTVVVPAGTVRQVRSLQGVRALVCSRTGAVVRVPGEDGDRGVPEWMS
jgi:quercetin dioxygenase-like cupin family protein